MLAPPVKTMADEVKTNATDVVVVKEPAPEVDLATKLSDTEVKLKKMTEDRDNYRRVALSKKGKSPDDGGETEDERIARIVKEQLYDTEIGKLSEEKDKIIEGALKENKELKVALKSRAQVGASTGQGANQDHPDVKTEFFTEAQKAELKKRYDNLPRGTKTSFEQYLERAKANYLKIKQS